MKDRAFTGRDVAEAVRRPPRPWDCPEAQLRYFVLDPGRPGPSGWRPPGRDRRPHGGRPRRGEARRRPAAAASDAVHGPEDEDPAGDDLETRLRRVTRALGEARPSG